MRKIILIVLASLLTLNHLQAQTPQIFFERHYINDLIFMNENDLLVMGAVKIEDVALYKVDENGEVVNSVVLPSIKSNNSHRRITRFNDGTVGLLVTKYKNDTIRLQKMTVHDDLSVDTLDFKWIGYDFYDFVGNEQWVEDASGNYYYSYYVDTLWTSGHHGLRILKFDGNGNLLKERLFDDPYPSTNWGYMFPTPDMTGCRLVLSGWESWGSHQVQVNNCYTLDGDLNTVSVKENIDQLSYPVKCGERACFRMNPYNGRTYTINSQMEIQPDPNDPYGNPMVVHRNDILMSMFDADNFEQMAYTWGITSHVPSSSGKRNSIDFDKEGDVYMAGGMDQSGFFPKSLYIVHLDEDLNKLDEIYYREDGYDLVYVGGMRVGANGDVFVNCQIWKQNDPSIAAILKFPAEAFLGIDEAHDAGFAVAVAYPNPGGNTLNIRTALTGSHVELYDTGGRLVCMQEITGAVTSINTEKLPSGIYVWKVIKDGSEAESGKWVKE
ncbi:MAG: T9SS type A sorting domain-containing protein [bacterium]|nr:T9SS type A sorting domain-containing protein [Candidatus Limimorpha caballi]